MPSDAERLSKLRLHFMYWVVILLLIIIAIATDRWTQKPDFTQYLTNAATMTSLVLAVVAIFYSFIANDGLSKSLGNISTVAHDVRESKDEMSKYVTLTASSVEAARENTKAIASVSEQLRQSLAGVGDTLNAINTQTASLNASVATLPPRLDQLESKFLDAAKSLGEKRNVPTATTGSETIARAPVERFLKVAPLTINLLCLALVLARSSKKELSINPFCTAIDIPRPDFFIGAIQCMSALDLVDRTYDNKRPGIYKILGVHPVLEETTKTYLTDYLGRSYTDKPEVRAEWLARVEKVEALFK